jgi:BCD family chlorophyll transporter-like MFS transporter
MLLVGMTVSALVLSALLQDFNEVKLIRVVQGAAVVTIILNFVALWKQEARNPDLTSHDKVQPTFSEVWRTFSEAGRSVRLLVAVGIGAAAFSMQDILLEPYGGEVLGLSVGATTMLTALLAGGTLIGLALASRSLSKGGDSYRIAGYGAVVGMFAFGAIVYSAPVDSPTLFRIGTMFIGLGGGLFVVGTMTAAMALARDGNSGIAMGAWGAVHATATGVAIAAGGYIRDIVAGLAESGALGEALISPATGYMVVYHIEILLLFVALVAIGPLVRLANNPVDRTPHEFGLNEIPS